MFSGIWTRWVPRAQVSVSADGRSARASHPSTPAVSVCTQRSRGAAANAPRGMRHASAPSARARRAGSGVSPTLTLASSTRPLSSARSTARA